MNTRNLSARLIILTALVVFLVPQGAAQDVRVVEDDEWCDDRGSWDKARVCEVREFDLRATDEVLDVDAHMNGGISVRGWDKNEILVRARVTGHARTEHAAREIVDRVELGARGLKVRSEGPDLDRNEGYGVSYRIFVPTRHDLELSSHNGGISIQDVSGDIEFSAVNGGVVLTNLRGDVLGETTNGGLTIDLEGDRWSGTGMDVRTVNGGVRINVPADYNAQLHTSTVNGGIDLDFPVTVKGRLDRNISTTLGDGGAPIRASTTNGGVRVARR